MQLQLVADAQWKQRFRAPSIPWTQLAERAPDRGLACTDQSGKGIADPAAIFPSDWSYGGYNSLMALGKRPDLWAGVLERAGR